LSKTIEFNGAQGQKFIDADYTIPADLLDDMADNVLTIKLVAHPGSVAGGTYYGY